MKVTTEKGFREKIRAACRGVGTYREEFEGMIYRLAELYVRREATKDEFRRSGGKAIIKQVNKGGNTYAAKNPLLTEIDYIDKNILEMERELGLTPQAIRKINEAALHAARIAINSLIHRISTARIVPFPAFPRDGFS